MVAFALRLNDAALRKSLVHTQPLKGIPKTAVSPTPAAAARPASGRTRGKDNLDHLFTIVYPRSLVEGPNGAAAPSSVQAGLQQRLASSEVRLAADRCPVNATPARVNHCEAAVIAADAALVRYHEAAGNSYGDEDGKLQDVVELSLAMDEACTIDDLWDHKE